MPTWFTTVLHFFALPEVGLPAIFIVAFVAATILPMATEPILFGYIKLNPDMFWWAILIATIGNTLGGMLTYSMGYGAKHVYAKKHDAAPRYFLWLQHIGAPMLLLSWLPLIGDALCLMAGWLKLPWRQVLVYMTIGKLLRFIAMTVILLWIPDHVWTNIAQWFQ